MSRELTFNWDAQGLLADLWLERLIELYEVLEEGIQSRMRQALIAATSRPIPSGEAPATVAQRRASRLRWKYADVANTVRQAVLLASLAQFEAEMNRMCDLAKQHYGLDLSFADLRDKGVVRARAYLKKVLGLRLRDDSRHWQIARNLCKIRNIIAHAGGRPANEEGWQAVDFLAGLKPGSIKRGLSGTVELGRGFVPFAGRALRSFILEICASGKELEKVERGVRS